MKFMGLALVTLGFLTFAERSVAQVQPGLPMNRSTTDDCEAEANRMFAGMRNLDERIRLKTDHVRKCRAGKRGQQQQQQRR